MGIIKALRLSSEMLFLGSLWVSLVGCGQETPKIRLAPITGGAEEATMFFEGFRMVSTHTSLVEWEFNARAAQIYEKIQQAKAQDIKIVYWRSGKIVSTLTARYGYINTETNDMRAEKDVVMVSHEGIRLLTEQLNWNQEEEKIYTDLPVRVERQGSILTGTGIKADSELKHIEILADVNIKVRSLKDLEAPSVKTK